jgi:hypothetical protein
MHDFAVYDILADGGQVFEEMKNSYGILSEHDASANQVHTSITEVGRMWDHISIHLRSDLDEAEEECMINCVRSCRGDIWALSKSLESMRRETSGSPPRPPLGRDRARILSVLERLQPAVKIIYSDGADRKRQAAKEHTSWGYTLLKLIIIAGSLALIIHSSAAKDVARDESTAADTPVPA